MADLHRRMKRVIKKRESFVALLKTDTEMPTAYRCIKCNLFATSPRTIRNCFKGGYHEWVVETAAREDGRGGNNGRVISTGSYPDGLPQSFGWPPHLREQPTFSE